MEKLQTKFKSKVWTRENLGDQVVCDRIILKGIIEKYYVKMLPGFV
jgi:hypothetical protein